MSTHLPSTIKSLFWSTPNTKPDLKKDASEIIHKVLAFGGLEDIQWLKKTYKQDTLQQLFQKEPLAIYTPSAFHFATTIVLHLTEQTLDRSRYVKAVY